MSSPLERRYRRVLRLLPPGYRRRWEEDMVAAFMEGAHASNLDGDGVPMAERLSVMSLAVRARLSGSHATPRGVVWHHVAHGVALMSLLYQSLAATVSVASGFQFALSSTMGRPYWTIMDFFLWSRGFGVLWVATFACLVMGRRTASRVLVVLALASAIGVTVATFLIVANNGAGWPTFGLGDVSRLAWLAVSVVTVFVIPPDAHASRRFWFGAYLVGSIILVPIDLLTSAPLIAPYGQWLVRFGSLPTTASAALIIAMAVVLGGVLPGRRPSPHWLLALAAFAGGIGGVRLMMSFAAGAWPLNGPLVVVLPDVLDAALASLALICAVVGLLALRRIPGRPLSSPGLARDQR